MRTSVRFFMPEIITFENGNMGNTYVLHDGKSALVFDMGIRGKTLENYLEKHGLSLLAVLLTHGHYDHIMGLGDLSLDVPVYIGAGDADYLRDPGLNLGEDFFGKPFVLDKIEPKTLSGGEAMKIGPFAIQTIATPFHTGGSLCYYLKDEGILFSGDTLFRLSIGRSDLPGSCPRFQRESLAKLKALPLATKVYPGHGKPTEIAFEIAHGFLGE